MEYQEENLALHLRREAERIFGNDQEAIHNWVKYWAATRYRNQRLVNSFQSLVLLDFSGKSILDVGCGTGGLGQIINSDSRYVGLDYHLHVLRWAQSAPNRNFLQGSAPHLPFADDSFDLIFAFDVVEHLIGGKEWQLAFFLELKRVLRRLGMIFLTTPNFWYPYDAHSQTYGAQFLPPRLADSYIKWRNSAFLAEHGSFREIHLMTPHFLKKTLSHSGLVCLHDLPCGLDRGEYRQHHPLAGPLVGPFGWYLHAEFWPILVHSHEKEKLRVKLKKHWYYEHNQPGETALSDFKPRIDFDEDAFSHQLKEGWYWYEREERGYRWIGRSASCYLQSQGAIRYLVVKGFAPVATGLRLVVDGIVVGEHHVIEEEYLHLRYLLPFSDTASRIFEVEIHCSSPFKSSEPGDERLLGVMVFGVELEP